MELAAAASPVPTIPSTRRTPPGTFLGCMPNNFIAVRVGTRLSSMQSLAELYDARMMALAMGAAILATAPLILKRTGRGTQREDVTGKEE